MKAATEFVGTFLFLFAISLVGPSGSVLTPLAIGGALMCVVYMGGHRSGGHYNPAVSLGLFLQKKIGASDFLAFVAAQVVAGILAFMLGYAIVGKPVNIVPGEGQTVMTALAVEAIFTFMLVLVVMNAAASRKTEGNSFYGLAIGFTIVVAATVAGPISGGAFNPAIGIGATIVSGMHGGSVGSIWIPIVGPLVGGAVASYFWAFQESSDPAPILHPAAVAIDQPATDLTKQ